MGRLVTVRVTHGLSGKDQQKKAAAVMCTNNAPPATVRCRYTGKRHCARLAGGSSNSGGRGGGLLIAAAWASKLSAPLTSACAEGRAG